MIHTNRFIALSCVVASVFATSCVNEIEEGLTSKSFVWRESAFVGFTDGKKYSATTVTPTDTKNQAQLQITTSLSQAYAENDVIWAVSPLEDTDISADNKVTFTLPNVYTQTALNSTEHLKDYVLMSGTGTKARLLQ